MGGCAADTSDHTLQVVFDVCEPLALVPGAGADPAELASLDAAIEMWNRLGQSQLSRATASSSTTQRTLEVRFETAAAVFYGVYDDERGVVFINHRLADHQQRAITIAHELGHAFGLFHIGGRDSVMNPTNLQIEPTAEDAEELRALWGDCP